MARYHRMQGRDVLHPMGWDAFGLPAENEARRHGRHPEESTRAYAATYRRQMDLMGISYDWSRELFSSDPAYYRWTQWLFLLLFSQGLAYRGWSRQWWCPECATVLANEQVAGGASGPVCWRGHDGVHRREIPQWFLRITAYADRLLAGLEGLDWPAGVVAQQRQWIGRVEGVEIDFAIDDGPTIPAFSTRPDTLSGVTAIALAPEHPLASSIAAAERRSDVERYLFRASRRSEIERRAAGAAASGVFTGAHARHPVTGALLPVWVADYVLPDVGTGAVMVVPGHDQRDAAFARWAGLPVGPVVGPRSDEGVGRRSVRYRLRDWSVGRQRFWGAPIPIVHCSRCGTVPVPEADLPVRLPAVTRVPAPGVDAAGVPSSPLARIPGFIETRCPRCAHPARREADTMDGFACSSWYFLRFASPRDRAAPFDPAAVARWLPVDLYIGGAEHAVMHLLYARFFTKVLHDAGLVPFDEPFSRLRNQGMILDGTGAKMSKSRPEHVVTPDHAVARYGADALRAYALFIAPFDQDVQWREDGLAGMRRFLGRVWRLVVAGPAPERPDRDPASADRVLRRRTHVAIRDVTESLEMFRPNVAVARLMEFANHLGEASAAGGMTPSAWSEAIGVLLRLMAPVCPHVAEELWSRCGQPYSIHGQRWPRHDPGLVVMDEVEIAVQVDGVVRGRVVVDLHSDDAAVRDRALAEPAVRRWLGNRAPKRVVVVPGRLVNVVTR